MLNVMRRNAGSWIIKIVLALIIIVFAFWGVGSYGEMRRNRVAIVDSHTITRLDFAGTYNNMLQQLRDNYGNELNDEIVKSLQLEKQAVTQLINRQVLMQAATNLGLLVSDEELRQSIYTMPVFQNESGQFDSNRYMALLSNMQMSSENFENMQQNDLLISKLMELTVGDIKVGDIEVEEWHDLIYRKVSADYVELNPAMYAVEVSPEEIQAYYDNHKDRFMTLPMRQIEYAKFDPKDYAARLEVRDEDAEEYYSSNMDLFEHQELWDVSQIVVRITEPGNEVAEEAAKTRIDEAAAKLAEGLTFAEVVSEYLDGAVAAQSPDGHVGKVAKEDLLEFFGDSITNLQAGEVSVPVKTDFSWHIFKINSIDAARTMPFTEVKEIIEDEIALNYARNMAYDDAEEVASAVFAGEDLTAAVSVKGVTAVTTDYFDRGMLINDLELQQRLAFTDFIFQHEVGDVSEPTEFEGAYYVVVILDEKAPELIPLTEVELVVQQAVAAEKQIILANEDAKKIIAAVKDGATLAEAVAAYNVTVKNTGLVTRYDRVDGLGPLGSAAQQAIFELGERQKVLEEPLPGPIVMVFAETAPADKTNFETDAAALRMQLLQDKQAQVFQRFLNEQKNKMKITVMEEFKQYYDNNI